MAEFVPRMTLAEFARKFWPTSVPPANWQLSVLESLFRPSTREVPVPLTESPSPTQLAKFVWVTARFMAYHRWKDAPESVAFLRDYHRHVFHVKLTVQVGHGDREVEFFTLKDQLQRHLRTVWEGQRFDQSCEQIAEVILWTFGAAQVEVSEDGENGATVCAPVRFAVWTEVTMDDRCAATTVGEMKDFLNHKGPVPGTDKRVEEVLRVRDVPFYGFEVEGPNVGVPTIFVPGRCKPKDLIDAWNDFAYEANKADVYENPFQVYLGAGNDRKVNLDTLRVAIQLFGPKRVVVEVEKIADVMCPEHLDQFVKGGGTVVTLSSTDYARYRPLRRVWRKIVLEKEKKVLIVTHAGRYESSLVDKEYGEDVTDAVSFVRRLLARKVEDAR